TVTYSYQGGLWSNRLRRPLDFRYVKAVLDAQGTYSETYFHQREGSSGVESSYLKSSSGAIYSYSANEFTDNSAPPYTSFITRKWAYDCSLAPSCRTTRTDLTYDEYENLVSVTRYGDIAVTGDEVTTVTSYVPNTTAYLVDSPS